MAAAAMEMDVLVWFTMDSTNQLKKGAAEKVQLDPTSDVTLKTMLERASFPAAEWHRQIDLGRPLGTTSPDCYFADDDLDEPGVCVYLDGLSEHIHGKPTTHQRDRASREKLRAGPVARP